MYLDLEDNHPDTPRVDRVISAREGVLLSIIFHLILGILYLVTPRSFFTSAPIAQRVPAQNHQTIQFVEMAPLLDRAAPPKRPAEQSDLDRRSATREKPPQPLNPMPLSHGNTPERKEGAPQAQLTPQPPAPQPAPPQQPPDAPQLSARGLETSPSPPAHTGEANPARAFSNLQRYLQGDNFDNPHGGGTDQSADIQFDSMGVDFGPWLRQFKDQVERNWLVPQAAMSLKGHVIIQFAVLRNGTIVGLHVVEPSSVDAFTTSAANALKLSNPTAALPTAYPADQAVITVTFHYNENYH